MQNGWKPFLFLYKSGDVHNKDIYLRPGSALIFMWILGFLLCNWCENNDRIILQPYSADLNLGDETHNAEGELARLDCSLFPSNLLVCTFIVLNCFRGRW